ncbi:heat shock protein Hsp20 [Scopulibacillus darangshiensis]|uniref:Heat shock protein Hsp20 n=1 Tax=Scopulibacillus darangshiensis TaxID=442528 RepID=A0A4R2NHU7_9BACL|nr:Hsp20/alpha crystallin family protein [Scopulibacillus darangshiensis]TCP20967.1 heat shock protein Hsp20 [Scopulibacillus darangshiensis]
MDKNDKNRPKKKSMPMGNNIMRQIDDFFASEPYRGILDSIDSFFQQGPGFQPHFPVDLYETADDWVVKADLPGVDRENIHIETMGDRLKIAVVNDELTEESHDVHNYYHRERRMQKRERVVALPYSIYKQRTKAKFHNGILEIRGPKYPKTKNTLDIE